MIRTIGNRAHDFGKCSASELARRISEKKLESIQLALFKAIEDLDPSVPIKIEQLMQIKSEMDKENIKIAVLGCYLNYGHLNENIRKKNIQVFKEHIDYAKILGARVVGTETGAFRDDFNFHPWNHSEEAYQLVKASLMEMVNYAEEKKVDIAIEPVADHIINTLQKLRRLLDEIDSKRIKVIFDPVNVLTYENHHEQQKIMDKAFSLFKDELLIVHAKGYKCNGEDIVEVPPNLGDLDYGHLVELIKSSPQKIDILLENVRPEKLYKNIKFILG